MAELLKVQDLSAGYGEAVVLNGVSFELEEGQTLALLGRNGTGKTTLMNTLAGVTRLCAPGAMTAPEAGWHHDGGFNLASLVRMIDIEAGAERASDALADYAQEDRA